MTPCDARIVSASAESDFRIIRSSNCIQETQSVGCGNDRQTDLQASSTWVNETVLNASAHRFVVCPHGSDSGAGRSADEGSAAGGAPSAQAPPREHARLHAMPAALVRALYPTVSAERRDTWRDDHGAFRHAADTPRVLNELQQFSGHGRNPRFPSALSCPLWTLEDRCHEKPEDLRDRRCLLPGRRGCPCQCNRGELRPCGHLFPTDAPDRAERDARTGRRWLQPDAPGHAGRFANAGTAADCRRWLRQDAAWPQPAPGIRPGPPGSGPSGGDASRQ